jgi:hypothetical protein
LPFVYLGLIFPDAVVAAFETKRKDSFKKNGFGSLENDILPAISLNDAPKIEAWVSSNPETYRYKIKPKKIHTGYMAEYRNRPKPTHVLAYACKVASHPAIFKALVQIKVSTKDPCIPELYSAYKDKVNITVSNKKDAPTAGRPERPEARRSPPEVAEEEDDEDDEEDDDGYYNSGFSVNEELILGNPWIVNMINLPIKQNESGDHYSVCSELSFCLIRIILI